MGWQWPWVPRQRGPYRSDPAIEAELRLAADNLETITASLRRLTDEMKEGRLGDDNR